MDVLVSNVDQMDGSILQVSSKGKLTAQIGLQVDRQTSRPVGERLWPIHFQKETTM